MAMLNGTDEPQVDRDRFMRTACLVYLLAATDAHAKNFSLLYSRGIDGYSMRLAPLYDIASAWPYPKQIPPQKMKLAMRIGRHYRWREIQLRHFEQLARKSGYAPEKLLETLGELAQRLPDEASSLVSELREAPLDVATLAKLLDALTSHCRRLVRQLQRAPHAPLAAQRQ
jgi:serine/threonine-protein kinase HipA